MTLSNGGVPLLGGALYRAVCPSHHRPGARLGAFRLWTLILTFLAYMCYHMSRKPISVVKTELLNCTETNHTAVSITSSPLTWFQEDDEGNCTSFINEMNGVSPAEAKRLEGTLDTSYLFAYAAGMFVSGFIAERVDLRYFLSGGMVLSGLLTMALGCAYYWQIHSLSYFIFIQVICGFAQSSGWPGVVTVVANWFGKGKKGLIFGIWNSHTSIGNIVGSLLAGAFVETAWGLSFIVPGAIISVLGVILFFIMIPSPEIAGLGREVEREEEENERRREERRSLVVEERSPLLDDTDSNQPTPSHSPIPPEDDDDEIESIAIAVDNFSADHPPRANSPIMPPLDQESPRRHEEGGAISLMGALRIPGVIEFSLCLFFAKLVSYTFLYWLPAFIQEAGEHVTSEDAAYLSTLFDVGGILGGILAGVLSDATGKSASTCAIMLVLAVPMLFSYQHFGQSCPLDMRESNDCYSGNIGLLVVSGLLVNGPYALITTAVSADLGTHPSLAGCAKALATVTAIIDGTGSIGAAIGPLIASEIPFELIFYALMLADICALLLLTRLIYRELKSITICCPGRSTAAIAGTAS